jgi:rod shape-determining protein MreD
MSARRVIVMLLAAWAALIVTSSLQALSPWPIPTPEVMLLIVLYLGLGGRGSTSSHMALALVLGYLADLFAGSPKGVHALTLAIAMLLARAASSRILITATWHTVAIAFGAALAHSVVLLALTAPLYQVAGAWGEGALPLTRLVPMTALTTALVAPFVFAFLRGLDRRLQPDPRALRI